MRIAAAVITGLAVSVVVMLVEKPPARNEAGMLADAVKVACGCHLQGGCTDGFCTGFCNCRRGGPCLCPCCVLWKGTLCGK